MHTFHMKKYLKVSLKQLKQELSLVASEAAMGATVEITRYNKPFLKLMRIEDSGVIVGKNVGSFTLKPLAVIQGSKREQIKGSIVQELLKDRS